MAARLRAMGQPKYQNDGDPSTSGPGFRLTLHPDALETPTRWRKPRRIFVDSMSDLLHPDVPDYFIDQVFDIMRRTPQHSYQLLTKRSTRLGRLERRVTWPENLWLGVSVENQRYAFRAAHLAATSARVKFVSAEPLLGPTRLELSGIDWLIVGAESGPAARPMELDWVRSLRDQASVSDAAFFFKQIVDASGHKQTLPLLDGVRHAAYPTT